MNTISFETKKHLSAGGITLGVSLLLFLLLYFIQYHFPVIPAPLEEMGMLVNLGNSETGSGDIQPLTDASESASTNTSAGSSASATTNAQNIETQENDPDAAPVKSTKVKKAVKPLQEKPDDQATAKSAITNAADKEAKRKTKEAADKKAKEDAFKNKLKNAMHKSNTSTGEGDGNGPGDQGVVDGDPNAKNHSGVNTGLGDAGTGYSIKGLKGRTPRKKALPVDNSKDIGKIAVNITVDKEGNVIKATYTEKGSTSSSLALRKAAIKAAKEWKFNEKVTDSDETGTVIFNFANR